MRTILLRQISFVPMVTDSTTLLYCSLTLYPLTLARTVRFFYCWLESNGFREIQREKHFYLPSLSSHWAILIGDFCSPKRDSSSEPSKVQNVNKKHISGWNRQCDWMCLCLGGVSIEWTGEERLLPSQAHIFLCPQLKNNDSLTHNCSEIEMRNDLKIAHENLFQGNCSSHNSLTWILAVRKFIYWPWNLIKSTNPIKLRINDIASYLLQSHKYAAHFGTEESESLEL